MHGYRRVFSRGFLLALSNASSSRSVHVVFMACKGYGILFDLDAAWQQLAQRVCCSLHASSTARGGLMQRIGETCII
jgi:hypothetical protein